ncbi:hypothetical protein JI435_305070, partial [Parastagonospora nodorum SN15]
TFNYLNSTSTWFHHDFHSLLYYLSNLCQASRCMTSCQHLTLPQQYQHIVDSELEPPVPHYQYVMSSLTDTYPCLHRSNIKSTTLTSTCINFSNITHLHNTSTCIDSSHTTSCS